MYTTKGTEKGKINLTMKPGICLKYRKNMTWD